MLDSRKGDAYRRVMAQIETLKLVFAGKKSNLVVIFPVLEEMEVGSSVFISGPNLSTEVTPVGPTNVASPVNSIYKRDNSFDINGPIKRALLQRKRPICHISDSIVSFL